MSKKYAHSMNDEFFYAYDLETKEEAVADAKKEYAGEEFCYIGEVVDINREWLRTNIRFIDLENIAEQVDMKIGEVSEGWLDGIEEDELNEIVLQYIYKKARPGFKLMENIKQVDLK